MIFFIKIAQYIFFAFTIIKTVSYGVWTIKKVNLWGGLLIIFLCITAAFLMGISMFTEYR